MMFLLLALLLSVVQGTATSITYTGHKNKKTWEEANKICEDNKGYLASITSDAEKDAALDAINTAGLTNKYVWIGLNDRAKEETYVWANDDPFINDYHFDGKWMSDEDFYYNNYDGRITYNCVLADDGKDWVFSDCSTPYPFVCQSAPASSQTTTASSWAPTTPTVSLKCGATSFDLDVVFEAPETGFTQMNDMIIAQGSESSTDCAKTSVSITTDSTQTFTAVSYGSDGSPGCGTGSTYKNDLTKIIYDTVIKVYVRQRKGKLQRTYIYEFSLQCKLTRDKTVTGEQIYKVTETAVEATDDTTKKTFDLDVELNFVKTDGKDETSTFTVDNMATLKAVLKEKTTDARLKFTVQSCKVSDNATPDASSAKTAEVIKDECNVDASVNITPGPADQDRFDFSTRALTLADAATDASHSLHCAIYICLSTEVDSNAHGGKCVQSTVEECKTKNNGRKRRSVENKEDVERTGVVSSKQTFMINAFDSVRCPAQAILDIIEKRCTLERIIKVVGVTINKEWHPEYANASSTAFKVFASQTERYIQSLILANGKENVIRGIRVISARSGSVVVDVHLTYADHVSPQMAFEVFKVILYNTPPQVTRIVKLLDVIHEKTIEFVPFVLGGYNTGGSTVDQNLLIVIGLVVGVIASICAVALYKIVERRRRRPVVESVGIDNIVVEKE